MKTSNKTISPWFWVPTLYFAEGVPYFVVNNISVMMFTKMGVPNGDMAFSQHCFISRGSLKACGVRSSML